MKFKTLRQSETGLKFEEINKKQKECFEKCKQIASEIGFKQWHGCRWSAFGGIESVYFEDNTAINTKLWKKGDGGFTPKRNSKEGKRISKILDEAPNVSSKELNMCIGFNGAPFKTIGFNMMNKDYFLFSTGDDWDVEIPSDCEEITVSEYKKLSESEL